MNNKSAVAFIDLLGFSNLVKGNTETAREILSDFYNIIYNSKEIANDYDVKTILVSDSLIASSNKKPELVRYISHIYRKCLEKTYEYKSHTKFILPRGAISFGEVYTEERLTHPDLKKNFIVSPALVHTAEIEKHVKGSRLLVAIENDSNDNLEVYWNGNTKSIFYEEKINLWSSHKYYDVLWFDDLSLDDKERKSNIEKYLDICIDLLHENKAQSEAIVNQYIETVRIGLLSYSKFMNIRFKLKNTHIQLLEDFLDDKFWKLWISILESFLLTSDSKWFSIPNDDLITFYNKIVLKKGWKDAINYLYNNDQESVLDKLNVFSRRLNDITLKRK